MQATPNDESANSCIVELMDACDTFIPEPERDVDKPFDACRRCIFDHWARYSWYRSYRTWNYQSW